MYTTVGMGSIYSIIKISKMLNLPSAHLCMAKRIKSSESTWSKRNMQISMAFNQSHANHIWYWIFSKRLINKSIIFIWFPINLCKTKRVWTILQFCHRCCCCCCCCHCICQIDWPAATGCHFKRKLWLPCGCFSFSENVTLHSFQKHFRSKNEQRTKEEDVASNKKKYIKKNRRIITDRFMCVHYKC